MLAKDLGFIHPRVMLQQMTAGEFEDWWEYYQADPWGEQRADARVLWEHNGNEIGLSTIVIDAYSSPEFSDEMLAQLEVIRNDRSRYHLDQAGRPDRST